jgi:hypothetical protein
MAGRKHRDILKKQIEARAKLWPDLEESMLWSMDNDGWVALPRLMPLIMSIMDDLSGKGYPVSRTYLEMWARLREEQFLTLNRPEEMAFHAGFEGQRALRTWKDRVQRLARLGFIGLKPGPLGDLSYAVFYNPYHVTKRAFLAGKVQERKWQALVIRANEVSAFDLDDVDEKGVLIREDEEEEEVKPAPKPVRRRNAGGTPAQKSSSKMPRRSEKTG